MFTGIVEELGTVESVEDQRDAIRLTVRATTVLEGTGLGDSIAVNGCCLTVATRTDHTWTADVMQETLDKTSLHGVAPGDTVNLERAVTADKRLGGHIVQGHVDGVGTVLARTPSEHWEVVEVAMPEEMGRYLVDKGSITVDGTSLTVNAVDGAEFELTIVPHTLAETIMVDYQAGRKVNLEVDLLARYLERLLLGDKAAEPKASGLTESFLAEHGYLNK